MVGVTVTKPREAAEWPFRQRIHQGRSLASVEDGSYMQEGHLAWLKQRHGHQDARLGESQSDEERCRQGGILA